MLSLDECEYLASNAAFSHRLIDFNGFTLHASAIEVDGYAYLFSASSGTGKSTHTSLWRSVFGSDRVLIINDDKPAIRLVEGIWYAYGTPWCGKEGYNVNAESPLHALCFLERGDKNEIAPIDSGEAVMRIFPQILLPTDEAAVDRLFALLDRMLRQIPCYLLRCTVSDEAVLVAYNGMKGN